MDDLRRQSGPLGPGTAQTTDIHSKSYPDGGDGGRLKTRGGFFDKSVRVTCDYAVGARDPISGKTINVKFDDIAQDRPLGLFSSMSTLGQYDTKRDTDSDLLRCEGVDYVTKEYYSRASGFMEKMSEPSAVATFGATVIPALAARLAQFEKTGATGNAPAFDQRENTELQAARAGK
ncbi:MAG: hypothetical protein KBG28_23100 [Kofleriaceae bacterium]|jgi:hypothetical protein|nr:hypothetical protein [Kofleriaceae bacterium]MBP6837405.1 hypothetical protein [Kofleriaceae bacterium]MBP9206878.1 hypothetical protein [Kofleriaceae bacterium]